MTDHDKSLFQQAMEELQGVTPLNDIKQSSQNTHQKPKLNSEKQRQVIRKLRQRQLDRPEETFAKNYQVDSRAVGNFETLSYFQPGLRSQEIDKLKKGTFANQAELDLHGMTIEQAEKALERFISQCYSYQMRYIRVIHGKGYNSEDNFPVLKNLVNQLLRQIPVIVGFHSAPAKQGGSGAVNILLKAQ